MSYISQITVGGEAYNLTPSFVGDFVYIEPEAGNIGNIPVTIMGTSYGKLYPYLASPYDFIGTKTILLGINVKGRGPAWGLGSDAYGGLGVYVYTPGNAMIENEDFKTRLGRLGLDMKGAIGVYVTGDDGIYTNEMTKCISLKLKTDLVTLESGERLGIYINPEGFLELIKV